MTRTAIATDTFTRADGTLGSDWTRLVPGSTSTPQVFSNAVTGSQITPYPCAVWSGAGTFSNDQYAQCTIGGMANQTDPYRVGVLLRASTAIDASRTYYQCTLSIMSTSGGSSNTVRISVVASNTLTELANQTNVTWTNGDTFLADVVGTTITVYRNGTQVLQTTDSTYSTGKPGLVAAAGFQNGIGTLDNWEGGSVTTSGSLFRSSPGGNLSGLGSSGPFFQNPLQ